MGISCNIFIPKNCLMRDVANCIGIFAGCKTSKVYISNNLYYVKVDDLKIRPQLGNVHSPMFAIYTNVVACCGHNHFAYYFHESFVDPNYFLLTAGDCDFWKVVGKKLVTFFGGYVDYYDSDDNTCDFKVKAKPNNVVRPITGRPWEIFQEKLLKLKPITIEEIEEFNVTRRNGQ